MTDWRDPALPGLETILDTGAFLSKLEKHFPEHGTRPALLGARIDDIQYTPGQRCSVRYRLWARDAHSSRRIRQTLSVHATPLDEPLDRPSDEVLSDYQQRLSRPEAAKETVLPAGIVEIPESGITIHPYPVDPVLSSLMKAVDSGVVKSAFHRMWHERNVRVKRIQVNALSITPLQRAALQYEVLGTDRNTDLPEIRHLVGKLTRRTSPGLLFSGNLVLWREMYGRVGLSLPVGYVSKLGLSLQEHMRGDRLADLAGTGGFFKPVRKTARALALVHALTLPLDKQRTWEKEARAVDRWTDVLATVCPDLTGQIERLRDNLVEELRGRICVCAPVHADFHLANVLVADGNISIVDWDQLAWGDPMVDVGRFLASLRVSALRVHNRLDGLSDVEEAFLKAYIAERPDDLGRARLFEAASLIIAAAGPFRLNRPGWQDSAAAILNEAERVLALSREPEDRTVYGHAAPAVAPPRLSMDARLRWAGDGPYVQAHLASAIHETFGAELTLCRVKETGGDKRFAGFDYILRGWSDSSRFRLTVKGHVWRDAHAGGIFRRLQAARTAFADDAAGPVLPRPLAYVEPLSLVVTTAEEGTVLSQCLDTAPNGGPAAVAGRAIAALHRADLEISKERDLARELNSLARRISRLNGGGGDELPAFLEILQRRLYDTEDRRALCIRNLTLDQLYIHDGRLMIAGPVEIHVGHPFLMIARLLAELASSGPDGSTPFSDQHVSAFRDAYFQAAGVPEEEFTAFEALGLLHTAVHAMTHRSRTRNATDLLHRARKLVPV